MANMKQHFPTIRREVLHIHWQKKMCGNRWHLYSPVFMGTPLCTVMHLKDPRFPPWEIHPTVGPEEHVVTAPGLTRLTATDGFSSFLV